MPARTFASRLLQEFKTRRGKNARYSLRAFAVFLGTDHSTLSQILRERRKAPLRQLRAWARKLGMDAEEAALWAAVEYPHADSDRHWTSEAMSILSGREHWHIVELIHAPEFQADSRWLAERIGVSTDQVNVALSRLLRLSLLEMSGGAWRETTGLTALTESGFRQLAIRRIRERAT